MPHFWKLFANGATSIAFGLLLYLLMHRSGNHRDRNAKIVPSRITSCILLGITLYSIMVCLFGHWVLGIPISKSIHDGFGDERTSWLMFGLMLDVAIRLYVLFDEQ